jgi:hypothetical protein
MRGIQSLDDEGRSERLEVVEAEDLLDRTDNSVDEEEHRAKNRTRTTYSDSGRANERGDGARSKVFCVVVREQECRKTVLSGFRRLCQS